MTDDERKKIFSQNLNRILNESSKSQVEVAKAIGVSQQTFKTWCRGIAIPRMGKIQLLADYFCVDMGVLIESAPERSPRDAQLARLLAYWALLSAEKKDALVDYAEYLNNKHKKGE